jgi:hypothetical protein
MPGIDDRPVLREWRALVATDIVYRRRIRVLTPLIRRCCLLIPAPGKTAVADVDIAPSSSRREPALALLLLGALAIGVAPGADVRDGDHARRVSRAAHARAQSRSRAARAFPVVPDGMIFLRVLVIIVPFVAVIGGVLGLVVRPHQLLPATVHGFSTALASPASPSLLFRSCWP